MDQTSVHSHVTHVGDWVEARGISGGAPRRGEIVELLGEGPHLRYRVRWDEKHESILYPADGIRVIADEQYAEPSGAADTGREPRA